MTYKEERLKHKRGLSTTEKILKIQELKASGIRNKAEIARIVGCSSGNVAYHWYNVSGVSKQESKRKPQRVKGPWTRRLNGQVGYIRERLYGITPTQYDEIFEAQEGKCAICGKHQDECAKSLAVDYDYTEDKVRGLLCSSCVIALGLFKDDPIILSNAMKYIIKFVPDA